MKVIHCVLTDTSPVELLKFALLFIKPGILWAPTTFSVKREEMFFLDLKMRF